VIAEEARAILRLVRNRIGWVVLLLAPLGCSGSNGDDNFSYIGMSNQVVAANFGADLLADVSVTVNGGLAKLFTVDTGAPFTILNATSFPDHADGAHKDDLAAFLLTFPELSDVSFSIAGDNDGIIGGNILMHFAFSLDYAGDRVWLGDPFDKEVIPRDVFTEAESDVTFDVFGGGTASTGGNCSSNCIVDYPATRVLVQVLVENQTAPVWMLIDTGASVVVLDSGLFNSLAQDPNRPRLDGVQLVAVSGAQTSFLSRVGQLKLIGTGGASAAVALDSVEIGVIPGTTLLQSISQETGKTVQGLIGATYLRYFLGTVDYQKKLLRLWRYNDPHVDPNAFIGPGFTLQNFGQNWALNEVYTNKDAYAQGLRAGQIVEEIGNQPLTGQSNGAVQAILDSYALGEEMPVTVNQSGNLVTVNVLVQDLLPTYPPP
jgi:Aspartyl protease